MRAHRIACLFAAGLFVAPAARADVHLGLEANTDFPVATSLRIGMELPLRLRASTSLGVLPGPYVALLNDIIVAAGGYDENTANVIESALSTSLVWRTTVGWRPLSDWGSYVDAGYTLVTLGGGVSASDLLAVMTGRQAPEGAKGASLDFAVASTLHLLVAETGYQWVLFDALTLRGALGFAGTVAASTTVEPEFEVIRPAQAAVDEFAAYGAAYLNDIYTSYVFSPTVTLGAGYQFF